MDVSDYRKRLQDEIDQAAEDARRAQEVLQAPGPPSIDVARVVKTADQRDPSNVAGAVRVALDPSAETQRRVMALELLAIEVSKRHDLIDLVIGLLRDGSAPPQVRRAALGVLRAASFRVATFAPKRPDYLDALRSLVEDPDFELRRQVVEILAQGKDEYVQRRIIDGLENPAAALVPPELALEFLGYDIHADHYPLLRELASTATLPAVKRQAVRLLSSDAASRELLERVLTDRNEDADVRATSAAALQALAPADFARIAARIVLDDGEEERLRAASVSALDHFSEPSTAENPDVIERIRQLQSIASGDLRNAASRFVAKRDKDPSK